MMQILLPLEIGLGCCSFVFYPIIPCIPLLIHHCTYQPPRPFAHHLPQDATWRLDQSVRDTTAQRQIEAITKLTSYSDPNAPSEKLIRCIIGELAATQCFDVILYRVM